MQLATKKPTGTIPLFKIYWDQQDVSAMTSAIESGMSWAEGPSINVFEDNLAAYVGKKHAVTFNSGTSALHAILLAYGIGEGDEVIVPSFTFIATANAPLFVGAKPVFAEIEETTYGLDPKDVKRKITSRTKAILPIHYAGCSCFIEELKRIADDNGLLLIEDAAEALGAEFGGAKAGSFGDAAVLSFCQNKIITTGEGGAVVTDSDEICNLLKLIRSQGRPNNSSYFTSTTNAEYVSLGYNFRMSSLTASLGIAQLNKIDKIIAMRKKNAQRINELLSQIEEVVIPKDIAGFYQVYQLYTIRLGGNSHMRDDLMQYLSDNGVISKVYFHPVHLTQFYKQRFGYQAGELPVTEKISAEVLTLPMYPSLSDTEITYIAEQLSNYFA